VSPDYNDPQYVEQLRRLTPAEGIQIALELTQQFLERERRAVCDAYPDADDDELRVRFVERMYGADLAEGFRKDLEKRRLSGHTLPPLTWCRLEASG
jgi:hypothetical protein